MRGEVHIGMAYTDAQFVGNQSVQSQYMYSCASTTPSVVVNQCTLIYNLRCMCREEIHDEALFSFVRLLLFGFVCSIFFI
jgi:hypothetical protein